MSKNWVLGYRRVSSVDQSLARQDLGDCDRIFEEKVSGKSKDRPELQSMLDVLRSGDLVKVWSIDRLGRNMSDLLDVVGQITGKGASITFLSERLTFCPNESDPLQTLQFQMMSAFAQFERSLIEKRRLEGIARAVAEGRYKPGRPRVDVNLPDLLKRRSEGASVRELASEFGISKTTAGALLSSVQK